MAKMKNKGHKSLIKKTVLADPHTHAGKLLPTRKVVQKGWTK